VLPSPPQFHRLSATLQIDDSQTGMQQRAVGIAVASVSVRSSTNHRLHHFQYSFVVTYKTDYTGNGAHRASLPFHQQLMQIPYLRALFFIGWQY
jgi:hypothetical protein